MSKVYDALTLQRSLELQERILPPVGAGDDYSEGFRRGYLEALGFVEALGGPTVEEALERYGRDFRPLKVA
jgi:hypothetical protein